MTITYADFALMLPWLGWCLLLGLLLFWIPKTWLLQLFESEKVPSIRLVAGFTVVVAVLCHAESWRETTIDALLVFAGTLFGFGTVKVIASRFTDKPTIDPTQQKDPANEPEKT